MKLNKIVGLGLAMVLGLGLVGCGDTEVEKQEQTVQQQEVQDEEEYQAIDPQEVERHENDKDENLNKEVRNGEYQFEEKEEEKHYNIDIEAVCDALDEVLGKKLAQIGIDYELYVYSEETDTIALVITIPKSELMATDINTWNQLVQGATQNWSTLASDYGYSFMIGIQDEEGIGYMVARNGVLYVDVFNGINKLN